jgi:hypothetical protein
MTDNILTGDKPTDLPKRAVRALTEKMTVLPDTGRAKGADDLYLVISQSGSEYLVDARLGACDCPDAHHNLDADEQCKHERRVAYVTGETHIPQWADHNAIDAQLGAQTETSPIRAATDGGVRADEDSGGPNTLYASESDECDCPKLPDDWPCADCYIAGKAELPE